MNKGIIIGILGLLLFGCSQSPEEVEANLQRQEQRFEIRKKEAEYQHKMELERLEKEKELYRIPGYQESQQTKALEEQATAAGNAADSLGYLEASAKVRDGIEAVGLGFQIIDAFSQ